VRLRVVAVTTSSSFPKFESYQPARSSLSAAKQRPSDAVAIREARLPGAPYDGAEFAAQPGSHSTFARDHGTTVRQQNPRPLEPGSPAPFATALSTSISPNQLQSTTQSLAAMLS
jgi:hypothetical protein